MKRMGSNVIYSCRKQWKLLLIIAVLSVFSSVSFWIHFKSHLDFEALNAGDYLFRNLRGMQWVEQLDRVIIPNGYWLAVNLLLAVAVGKGFDDMSGGAETQRILRLGSRKNWWKLKFRECILNVLIYYAILVFSTAVSAFFMKGAAEIPHVELVEEYGGMGFEPASMFLAAIIFVLLTSVAISAVQALITVVLDIKIGFVWVSLVLVLAIYTKSWWNIGSSLMMIRLSQYRVSDYVVNGGLCIALTVLAYGWGNVLIKKKEFLKKGK